MNFIFKGLTFVYSVISYFERKVFVKNIKKEDLVLDVGSGDKPFWRADVLVDKYLKDNQQRYSGSMFYDKRKIFVKADVENLPFKDKVFDFVFCAHLLEHVKNPDKAIQELTRVGKKGYIEIPSAIGELFSPFPPHLWYCSYENKILTFRQKEKEDNFFRDSIAGFGKFIFNNNAFQYLLAKNFNKILICLYWEDNLDYRIIRARRKTAVYEYKGKPNENKNLYLKTTFLLYKIFYGIITFFFYKKKDLKISKIIK